MQLQQVPVYRLPTFTDSSLSVYLRLRLSGSDSDSGSGYSRAALPCRNTASSSTVQRLQEVDTRSVSLVLSIPSRQGIQLVSSIRNLPIVKSPTSDPRTDSHNFIHQCSTTNNMIILLQLHKKPPFLLQQTPRS